MIRYLMYLQVKLTKYFGASAIVQVSLTNEADNMLSLLKKDPAKQLNKAYQAILEQAMQAQRKGDIKLYSELTDKAEGVLKKLEEYKLG